MALDRYRVTRSPRPYDAPYPLRLYRDAIAAAVDASGADDAELVAVYEDGHVVAAFAPGFGWTFDAEEAGEIAPARL